MVASCVHWEVEHDRLTIDFFVSFILTNPPLFLSILLSNLKSQILNFVVCFHELFHENKPLS